MSDLDLRRRLEQSVPLESERPDWAGVVKGVRSARRRTRLVRLAVVAALLSALLVTPAVGGRLFDVIAGEPAPEQVKEQIRQNDVPPPVLELIERQSVDVDLERAHGVMSIGTSVGPVNLWIAPKRSGGDCRYLEVQGSGLPLNCAGKDGPHRGPVPAVSGELHQLLGGAEPDRRLLHGLVVGWQPGYRLEWELENGRRLAVRVAEDYFIHELPKGSESRRLLLVRQGSIVASQDLVRPPAAPVVPMPEPEYRKVLEVTTFAGGRAVLSVAAAPPNQTCWSVQVDEGDGSGSGSGGCGDPPSADIGVNADLANALLFGTLQVPAASLEVLFEDGDRDADVPLREGFFLYPVPKERLKKGHLPSEMIARDAQGKVVARDPVVSG